MTFNNDHDNDEKAVAQQKQEQIRKGNDTSMTTAQLRYDGGCSSYGGPFRKTNKMRDEDLGERKRKQDDVAGSGHSVVDCHKTTTVKVSQCRSGSGKVGAEGLDKF